MKIILNNADYYVRRERQERALAQSATDPTIRDIHAELARRYADLQQEAARVPA